MPRKPKPLEAIARPTEPHAIWLWERLVERGWSYADFAKAISPEKRANDVQHWFGTSQPSWSSLSGIARALKLPFHEVRIGLGYTDPDVVAPEPLDSWELTTQRLAGRLVDVLRRVPAGARDALSLVVEAGLDLLSSQVDRLRQSMPADDRA